MNNIILSIESSSNLCGVALSNNSKLIDDISIYQKNVHDKVLAKNIKNILENNNLDIHNIDAVAVASGPGSFTGLRVGISLAKALTFDNSPKLIAIPSTLIWAYPQKKLNNSISVMIKSHGPFYYFHKFDMNLNELNQVSLIDTDQFDFKEIENDIKVGEYPENIIINNSKQEIINLVELAHQFYDNKQFVDSNKLVPLYVQKFIPKTKSY
jgi:tRNA threonylcarbamoyladenosine biosynthesis protein TsaB